MGYVDRFKPAVMEGNDTMEGLYGVDGVEVEKLHGLMTKISKNWTVSESDLDGIKKWEVIYNIASDRSLTLEERREKVFNKILFRPPFTRHKFQEILRNIWGEGEYEFEISPDDFTIFIDIGTESPYVYIQFIDLVRKIIPANMQLLVSVQYTYAYMRNHFTYDDLAGYTYAQLMMYNEGYNKPFTNYYLAVNYTHEGLEDFTNAQLGT